MRDVVALHDVSHRLPDVPTVERLWVEATATWPGSAAGQEDAHVWLPPQAPWG